jgi:hypothetical protein
MANNCPLLDNTTCPGIVGIHEYVDMKVNAIKETFQARVESVDKATALAIEAVEKATTLAAQQLEKRLEGMNEFRNALKDQNSTMLPRLEYVSEHKALATRIEALELSRAELQGKANQSSVNIATLFSVVGIAISVGSLVLAIIHVLK